jgi:serine/threonine-protein kinase
VLDTGTSTELGPFIVMEYLEGDDLSRHIRAGFRASVATGIDYVVQAADAIAHAHTVGVIHRDVKPANMFLVHDPGGAQLVKVIDFGISKVVEEVPLEITKTSTLLGSGLYMSPEQMRSAKSVDHRTDIYSLGISLYELYTGTQPFVADSYPDLCIKVMMEPPVPLRSHRPDIPEELARAVAKAYARAPGDRYQSVPEFVAALAPWATAETRARIDEIVKLGRARPPMASGDFQSVAPPPPAKLPHPGATTMPMAPRVPNIVLPSQPPAEAHAAQPGRGSQPSFGEAATLPSGFPSLETPAAAATRPSQIPAARASVGAPSMGAAPNYSSVPPRASDPTHLPAPALAESSAKSFAKTTSTDSTARTVAIAALGTFGVCCALVVGYFFVGRSHATGPAPTEVASPGAQNRSTSSPTSPDEGPSPSATQGAMPPSPTASAAPTSPSEASSEVASNASAAPSASSSATPGKKHHTLKPPPPVPGIAHPPATSQPASSDPFGCVDPVTKLRVPCH